MVRIDLKRCRRCSEAWGGACRVQRLRFRFQLNAWRVASIVSPEVVYEGLKAKEAVTVSLGKFDFADQLNQEHHDDHQEHHYGTGRAC